MKKKNLLVFILLVIFSVFAESCGVYSGPIGPLGPPLIDPPPPGPALPMIAPPDNPQQGPPPVGPQPNNPQQEPSPPPSNF